MTNKLLSKKGYVSGGGIKTENHKIKKMWYEEVLINEPKTCGINYPSKDEKVKALWCEKSIIRI